MIAGGVEGIITYPTEYVKTQLQIPNNSFKSPLDCLTRTVRNSGLSGLYKGVQPLVIGNASKAGVRFLCFDQLRELFGTSKTASVFAGLGAGMMEAVMVVTPSETIKTKLIHDQNSKNPQFKSFTHGVRSIIAKEGLRGTYKGVTAVVARQGANSAVRMSSYGIIREQVNEWTNTKGIQFHLIQIGFLLKYQIDHRFEIYPLVCQFSIRYIYTERLDNYY
jgi:solute carrier family 25 citrate transporter 1